MDRKNANNRSLLAMAGEQSLISSQSNELFINKSKYSKKQHNKDRDEEMLLGSTIKNVGENNSKVFDTKQIIKKLGLARLRKMQALVRGFLVRRTIYPKELQDYLIAQSALDLIISNVVYRECSGMVVETVTLGRYDQDLIG